MHSTVFLVLLVSSFFSAPLFGATAGGRLDSDKSLDSKEENRRGSVPPKDCFWQSRAVLIKPFLLGVERREIKCDQVHFDTGVKYAQVDSYLYWKKSDGASRNMISLTQLLISIEDRSFMEGYSPEEQTFLVWFASSLKEG